MDQEKEKKEESIDQRTKDLMDMLRKQGFNVQFEYLEDDAELTVRPGLKYQKGKKNGNTI